MVNPTYEEGKTVLVFVEPAEAVELRTFMPGFPTSLPFQRMANGSHRLEVHLPHTARIEYRLAVRRNGSFEESNDPLNPLTAPNPYGTNSVAGGPGYLPNSLSVERAGIQRGRIVEIRVSSRHFGMRRHHQVYLPPFYTNSAAYPLLVVHDGPDFLAYSALSTVLDNLIDDGTINPVLALLLDPRERLEEYAASPRHSAHLIEEVLPHLHRRFPVSEVPSERVLLGASMGAVASLRVCWDYPASFQKLFLVSGSFRHRPTSDVDADVFAPIHRFLEDFAREPRLADARIYQSVGRYEGLVEGNRKAAVQFRAAGATLRYEETWDGHHWGSWSDRLPDGLTYLLGRR